MAALVAAVMPPPLASQATRAIVGATLIDGTGAAPVADAVVVVRDGRIVCAGTRRACSVPVGSRRMDGRGSWIIPGLIDAHVHFSQTGWFDGRPDAADVRDRFPYPEVEAGLATHPERFFRSYLCSGVTSVFDVGGDYARPRDAACHKSWTDLLQLVERRCTFAPSPDRGSGRGPQTERDVW